MEFPGEEVRCWNTIYRSVSQCTLIFKSCAQVPQTNVLSGHKKKIIVQYTAITKLAGNQIQGLPSDMAGDH